MSILETLGGEVETTPEVTLTINPEGEQVLFQLRGLRLPDIALFSPWGVAPGTFHIHCLRGDHTRVKMRGAWVLVNKPGSGRAVAHTCECGLRFTMPDMSMSEPELRAYVALIQCGQSATA